jgi:hypothetical protein
MFNVLPDNLKKLIVNEYYTRVGIVACLMALVAVGCAFVFLFPSWLMSHIKQQEIAHQVSMIQDAPVANHISISNSVVSTNQLLQVMNTTFVYPPFKPLLDTILTNRVVGITLGEFDYTVTDATHGTISLHGVSATRDELVAFVKALQNSNTFASVDLPVSDLAHDTNIEFVLNIVIGQPQPASQTPDTTQTQ